MVRIAVIGAGAVGLASAVNIQQQNPTSQVTILAEKFANETTSSGAGGIFYPHLTSIKGVSPERLAKWLSNSFHFFGSLARSSLAEESGQSFVSSRVVKKEPLDVAFQELMGKLTGDFQVFSEKQMKTLKLDPSSYGYSFTTIVTVTPKYMRYLTKLFHEAGGKIQHRKIQRIPDLAKEFDVVVNCCGLGGKELVPDSRMFPIKGHLIYVDAPWMNHYFSADGIYLIPHPDKLVIGGLREAGDGSMVAEPAVRERTMAKALAMFPHLATAKVLGEWVGLRPGRDELRFEMELMKTDSGTTLPVIHNYGHAGDGINLSWGCGLEAANLVNQALDVLRARI